MIKKLQNRKLPSLDVEFEREDDGRWIAEFPGIHGAMAYGSTREEAVRRAYAIFLRTLADKLEQREALVPATLLRPLKHAMARN